MTRNMSGRPLSYEQIARSDNPPDYHADFSQIHTQWKKSVDAALQADELADRLSAAKKELAAASKLLKQLKEKRSAKYLGVTSPVTHGHVAQPASNFSTRKRMHRRNYWHLQLGS